MKPVKILLFTLGVFLLLAGTMWLTPADGIKLGAFTFHMPTFREMLVEDDIEYADVSEILDQQFDIDSLMDIDLDMDSVFLDSIAGIIEGASYDSLVASIYKVEMTDTGKVNLYRFFNTLHDSTLVRIMHYGDSQIEGDRITSFIRNKFQVKFGGSGPGLRPALQPYDYIFSAVQESSETGNAIRFTEKWIPLVEHDRYGVMGAFSRYAPPASDTIPFKDSVYYDAELSISKSDISYKLTKEYKNFRMFYGNAKSPVADAIDSKSGYFSYRYTAANLDYGVVECALPDSVSHISLTFFRIRQSRCLWY